MESDRMSPCDGSKTARASSPLIAGFALILSLGALPRLPQYQKMIDDCDREIRLQLEDLQPPTAPEAPATEVDASSKKQSAEGILRAELQRVWSVDLTKIPRIRTGIAQTLLGEIGPDFTKFRSASAFASWMGLCPDNDISGGKVLFVATRKVKCRAALALRMAAQSLHHSKSALSDFYRRMRARLGAPTAITAAAHKLARIICHLISTRQEFDDSKFAPTNCVTRSGRKPSSMPKPNRWVTRSFRSKRQGEFLKS